MIDKSITQVYTVVINSKGAVGFVPAASFLFFILLDKSQLPQQIGFSGFI